MQARLAGTARSAGRPSACIAPGRASLRCRAAQHARGNGPTALPAAPPTPAAASPLDGVERHRAFLLAQDRLETLLEEAKLSNKDTVPVDHLDALSPEERLTLFTNLGTLALLAEVMSCWLFGESDPLGGMDFTAASAHAAMYGAAFAVPLVLCSVAARTRLFKRQFPVLEQLHQQQAELQRHFTAGMNPSQMGIWLSFVIVPSLLTLLPATRAGVTWCASFAQAALLQTWASGLSLPHLPLGTLAALLTPLVSSYVAGMASASCFGVRPKQIEMLRDALRNADAYFRLAAARQPGMTAGGSSVRGSTSSSSSAMAGMLPPSVFASTSSLALDTDPADMVSDGAWEEEEGDTYTGGQAAADAFKTLAMVWLVSRRRVAQLAAVLTGMNVMYFSVILAATGDMTTPIVAAMLHAGVEVWHGEQKHAVRSSSNQAQ